MKVKKTTKQLCKTEVKNSELTQSNLPKTHIHSKTTAKQIMTTHKQKTKQKSPKCTSNILLRKLWVRHRGRKENPPPSPHPKNSPKSAKQAKGVKCTHIFISGNFRGGKISVETSKPHNGPHWEEAHHCLYDSASSSRKQDWQQRSQTTHPLPGCSWNFAHASSLKDLNLNKNIS